MIRILSIFLSTFLLNHCSSSQKHINTPPPPDQLSQVISNKSMGVELTFDYEHIELGEVAPGETRDSAFIFENTGDEVVVIDLVSACECTTLDYSTDPIKPGETSRIDFIFDSSSKEEDERITLDILLRNVNPNTGYAYVFQVTYDFEILKP